MGCWVCGDAADIGGLCRRCALEIAPCDGLIADHVRSTVAIGDALAWVVDGFGNAHPLTSRSAIGRAHEGQLVVLATSVSREHAEVRGTTGGAWEIRDLGSRNGTFVDGARVKGRAVLPARTKIKVGDVAMWFIAELAAAPPRAQAMVTGSVGSGLVRYVVAVGEGELCVVGTSDSVAGGALLTRAPGAEMWTERALPPLEFQLLRALCSRAADEGAAPSAVRGCVATKQLAKDLPFQSKYPNEENVRQVVRRLRGVLAELGLTNVLAVAPGRGYYVTCPVTVAAIAPAGRG